MQDASTERVEAIPSEEADPFDLVSRDEDLARLAATIAALPERERLVLSLYYFEDLQIKDIAVILGVTDSRVSQIHTAAVNRLRRRHELELLAAAG